MKFTQYEPQIVAEAFQEIEVTTEGWGRALAIGLGLAAAPVTLGFSAVVSSLVVSAIDNIFDTKVAEAIKSPAIKKYIIDSCDKVFKEENKKNHNITSKIPSGWIRVYRNYQKDDINVPWYIGIINSSTAREFSLGKYTVYFYGDSDGIKTAFVVLWDEAVNAPVVRKIAAPTNKEIEAAR